jgi:hypothetical protein
VKLATYRLNEKERLALVHDGDNYLFDLAAASKRAGIANPAFDSMLALIDSGEAELDQARRLFERYGKDTDLSTEVADSEILAPVPSWRALKPSHCPSFRKSIAGSRFTTSPIGSALGGPTLRSSGRVTAR